MKIPRRDLLMGSVSIELPPASAQELAELKRFIVLASIVLLPAFFLGIWCLVSHPVLGGALMLLSGTAMGALICSSNNYDRITTPQATALSRLVHDGLLSDAEVQFIRDVAALGRELSAAEAVQLINRGQSEEKKQQRKAVYEVAEKRGKHTASAD